ncbi:MAG: hypothetical protein JNM80_10360 [Phycisphaerae bacterium]|nr:hypothetical protein [Phycisphaerae bacterium]
MPHDRAQIVKLPLSGLAALYNSLSPARPVRKFPDRETALRRVFAALEEAESREPAPDPAPAPVRAARGREGGPRPARKAARRTSHQPTGELRPPRPGSKRGRLLARLMGGGMTAAEIGSEFQWTPRDVADALRLLAHANGYVVYMADGGETWHAAEPDRDGMVVVVPAPEVEPVRAAAQPGSKRRGR